MLGCSCDRKGSNSSSKMLRKAFPSEGSVIILLILEREVEQAHAGLMLAHTSGRIVRKMLLRWVRVCVRVLPDLSVCALHAHVLSGDLLPSLCLLHHRLSVHQTKAIQVAHCETVIDRQKRFALRWWRNSATTNYNTKVVRLGQKWSQELLSCF